MTAAASKPKKPFTTFPKFDGKSESVPLFFEKILGYKADRFYVAVTDWTHATPVTATKAL